MALPISLLFRRYNNAYDDKISSSPPLPGAFPELSSSSASSSNASSSSLLSTSTIDSVASLSLSNESILVESPTTDDAQQLNQPTGLDALPTELCIRIFSYLDVPKLLKASMVCKGWNEMAYDGNLWGCIDMGEYYKYIGQTQLQRLARRSAGFLRYANFRGCLQLTSAVMRAFAVNCHNIEFLCLAGCRSAGPASIAYLLAKSPSLKTLDFSGLGSVNNTTLEILSSHCPTLVSLKASFCRTITVVGITALARGCPQLSDLQLAHCGGLDDDAVSMMATLHGLKRLVLASCPFITDQALISLSKSESVGTLRLLNISNCPLVTDVGLVVMVKATRNLGTLEVAGCRLLTDVAVTTVATNCPRLHHLDLEECVQVTDNALITVSAHLNNTLQAISLSYCDAITDEGALSLLRQCRYLEHLELDNCSRITNEVLLFIGREGIASGLKELAVWDCRLLSPSQLVAVGSTSGVKIRSFYTRSQEGRSNTNNNNNHNNHNNLPMPMNLINNNNARRGRPSCNIF
ncbi:hypothetical protein SmJEL517_g03665 [Synchytrium microbalum]|uniref:F-box domain-containing protein n=1 Tax=Synchytrium microbalum TaxID=1806994 RepID=A0A507C618_9FUNG|nr:uncharacterized protein SmJEL517_g03665 [Synchytrium microbalum]TPX33504.1 hypothetical protein SmJEL517_g03665 [Synchytrium microbalum]